MGAGARYLGLDWALCPRTSPFPLWASVSLSAERSKELSVITWFQPFPPTSQCTDGEAEAQRGDRIPDFIDMRGQSTMGPKPCTCDLWGGVGRGGRRDFWEEAEVWAGWGLPGEGPGVCGARPPAPLMCSPLEVMRRACPLCSRMSCRMPPHTCVRTPPYCVSTVRTLCPAAWPHAHALRASVHTKVMVYATPHSPGTRASCPTSWVPALTAAGGQQLVFPPQNHPIFIFKTS